MKRLAKELFVFFLISAFTLTFPLNGFCQLKKEETQKLILPKNTTFLIEFLDGVDSGENKTGDKIRFETREDVVLNGARVIPYGTKGLATLKKVKKSGLFGRGGSLDIDFGSLRSLNNIEIPIEIGKSAAGKNEDAGIIVPVAALFIFLPLVLFGFMEGHEARIPSGTQIYVNVRDDINLDATPKEIKKILPDKEKIYPVEISEIHICEEIDPQGNPQKIRDWFNEDSKSIFVWASIKKMAKSSPIFIKWYFQDNLSYSKKVNLSHGDTKFYSLILPPNGKRFKKGNWKMEIISGDNVIKSVPFAVKEE